MKSIEKVKRQRRIRQIPSFCDNPMSKEDLKLQELVKKGAIQILVNRRARKMHLKRPVNAMRRNSN